MKKILLLVCFIFLFSSFTICYSQVGDIYVESFDSVALGAAPPSFIETIAGGGTLEIKKRGSGNNYLEITDTTNTWIYGLNLGIARQTGRFTVAFDYLRPASTVDSPLFYVYDDPATVQNNTTAAISTFLGNSFSAFNGSGSNAPTGTVISPDSWHRLTCDINFQTKSYTMYVDGEIAANNFGFRNQGVTGISNIYFCGSTGQSKNIVFSVDNIAVYGGAPRAEDIKKPETITFLTDSNSEKSKNAVIFAAGNNFCLTNGLYRDMGDNSAPFVSDGVYMVPLEALASLYGADAVFNSGNNTVLVTYESASFVVTVGSAVITTSSGSITAEKPAMRQNSFTFIPINAAGEIFNKEAYSSGTFGMLSLSESLLHKYFSATQDVFLDRRNILTGSKIAAQSYADQPFVVKTNDNNWLCVTTTAAGHEGTPSQHVISTRSADLGATWSSIVDVEPSNSSGPESSYAVLFKNQAGRIYTFYNHNTDNLRQVLQRDGNYTTRVDTQGYYVFKYSDDNGKTWSSQRYNVPVRAFDCDIQNPYGGAVRFFWNVGKPFVIGTDMYLPFIKVGQFGIGFLEKTEGVLLKSPNILTEQNPANIVWETLPEGTIGLKTPAGGGPVSEEQSFVTLSDNSIFVVYRSTDGHPVYSYSRDLGITFETPKYLAYPDGRLFKHPRAANFIWNIGGGKYLYWFHNHGGTTYDGRNPAFLCLAEEVDGPGGKILKWGQPEILLYDDTVTTRMSYPDLIMENGNFYITETQKSSARCHYINPALIKSLTSQFEVCSAANKGLISKSFGQSADLRPLLPFTITNPFTSKTKNVAAGHSIELLVTGSAITGGEILYSTKDAGGKGVEIKANSNKSVTVYLSNGTANTAYTTQSGVIENAKTHLVITLDGGPFVGTIIKNGIMLDGGTEKTEGWFRFSNLIDNINGRSSASLHSSVSLARVYDRALFTSEAIGNYRSVLSENMYNIAVNNVYFENYSGNLTVNLDDNSAYYPCAEVTGEAMAATVIIVVYDDHNRLLSIELLPYNGSGKYRAERPVTKTPGKNLFAKVFIWSSPSSVTALSNVGIN